MDNPTLDHSDSDSGESWTLLEHNSALAEDAPNLIDNQIKSEKEKPETHEKDDDTDGISIISDSDPESASPCQMHYETLYEEDPDLQHLPQCPFNLAVPDEHNDKDDSDFLNIDHGKHKTYVHRRNKRLSTVLNIIVLGSVITAAGVAIGHMWGARTDRSINTIPNVNNILSNLYKLQEENAYLRNKVKELTAMNDQQNSQFKGSKHNKCRKVFEESLNNDNTEKSIKCVDDKVDFSGILHNKNNKLSERSRENDFKENINTLKNIYLENKNWLDDEIVLRLQQENLSQKRIKKSQPPTKLHKINEEKDSKVIPENIETIVKKIDKSAEQDVKPDTPKLITYADSLKSLNEMHKEKEFNIKNITIPYYKNKRNKHEKVTDHGFESPISEEDIVKDSRYVSPKFKQERKKNDRPKSYKKQKRRNKYEQWEMKGGLMKDYDDITVSQDPNNISNDPHLQEKIEKRCIVINKKSRHNDYITQDCNVKFEDKKAPKHKNSRDELNLPNSRSMYRADMKRLEEGLFGGEANPAGWYFRRMHKREQCRAKANNTYQKFSKRNKNYKMKH